MDSGQNRFFQDKSSDIFKREDGRIGQQGGVFDSGQFIPDVVHPSGDNIQDRVKMEEKEEQGEDQESAQYYCMTCNKNYNIKMSVCKHKKSQKGRYKCTYSDCRRSFQIEATLERHKLIHEGIKPYECDFQNCQQRFNQKSNLNRHKRVHTQQKPFICQTCCKSFTTTTNLKQHVQIHLEDRDRRKKYICEIKGCNKEYFYMCNLKKHKQEHEDPMSDCLFQKKPDGPVFGISIGNCSFRIVLKRSKDHYEVMITHQENIDHGVQYGMDLFERVLRREEGSGEESGGYVEELDNIVRKMFEETRNALNIAFQMHEGLRPISNQLVKTLISVIGETNLRVFTIIVPHYDIFSQMVNNLMSEFEGVE